MKTEPLHADEWCDRCAKRFTELDQNISYDEAQQIAQDVCAFERTRAMNPEAAANFVAFEMSRPDRALFERRSVDRSQQQPFLSKVLRVLTPGARAS
jgi:hypothetical protein